MRRPIILLAALVTCAALSWAGPSGLTREVCFLASDAGQVPTDTLSFARELQNLGSTTLWCGLQAQGNALENHSRSITAGATWAIDSSGNLAIWCVAGGGVDQQPLLSDGGTADGGPAGCTIVNYAH